MSYRFFKPLHSLLYCVECDLGRSEWVGLARALSDYVGELIRVLRCVYRQASGRQTNREASILCKHNMDDRRLTLPVAHV